VLEMKSEHKCLYWSFPETQNRGLLEELAYVIMEADKPQAL
jgi:hypothetical protein